MNHETQIFLVQFGFLAVGWLLGFGAGYGIAKRKG